MQLESQQSSHNDTMPALTAFSARAGCLLYCVLCMPRTSNSLYSTDQQHITFNQGKHSFHNEHLLISVVLRHRSRSLSSKIGQSYQSVQNRLRKVKTG